jgi:hypothetical protein
VTQVLAVLGTLLVLAAVVLVVADSGDLSSKMPTQVPPRRFARSPLTAGIVLIAIAVIAWLLP